VCFSPDDLLHLLLVKGGRTGGGASSTGTVGADVSRPGGRRRVAVEISASERTAYLDGKPQERLPHSEPSHVPAQASPSCGVGRQLVAWLDK
jgi:hypothetical protein